MIIYAGIGSRRTPTETLRQMAGIAEELASHDYLLRSGHAEGADLAFESRAKAKEIHLPWEAYNNAPTNNPDYWTVNMQSPKRIELLDITARHHPAWERLTNGGKLLMCRNTTIILGKNLDQYVKMVICWTPGGRLEGGTAHGIRLAHSYDIPVFNIALPEDQQKLCRFVQEQ